MVSPVTGPDARAHRDTDGEVLGSPTAFCLLPLQPKPQARGGDSECGLKVKVVSAIYDLIVLFPIKKMHISL